MKVLNLSETSIFLDDVNLVILYSRNKAPQEIDDKIARRSRTLKIALQKQWIMDVTNGVPATLPPKKSYNEFKAPESPPLDPERPADYENSPYMQKQAMLVKDEHYHDDHRQRIGGMTIPGVKNPNRWLGKSAKDVFLEENKTPIIWTGPTYDAGGYALMNRQFMKGLEAAGVPVQYELLQSQEDMDAKNVSLLKRLQANRVPPDAPKIYGMTAPLIYDWARRKVLFTMMETRVLHKDYTIRCNCADEIIVPSQWCLDIFRESGVKVPMTVVPLGVDTSLYKPNVEPVGFSKKMGSFVFLSVFGWSMRKGYDVLLKAYLEEFTSDDDVTLLISSRFFGSTDESKKQFIRNDIERVSSMVKNPKKPQIVLFGDVLSEPMMPRLFAAADCYVLFSRGEGFGLPYIEAGACKKPVIATRYSGQTDFLNDDNSYLVDIDGFSKADRTLAMVSYFYEDAEFPTLGPKVVEQARVQMRRAFENRDEANAKAARLHDKIVKEYDWKVCIDKMCDKVRDTYGKMFPK